MTTARNTGQALKGKVAESSPNLLTGGVKYRGGHYEELEHYEVVGEI